MIFVGVLGVAQLTAANRLPRLQSPGLAPWMGVTRRCRGGEGTVPNAASRQSTSPALLCPRTRYAAAVPAQNRSDRIRGVTGVTPGACPWSGNLSTYLSFSLVPFHVIGLPTYPYPPCDSPALQFAHSCPSVYPLLPFPSLWSKLAYFGSRPITWITHNTS